MSQKNTSNKNLFCLIQTNINNNLATCKYYNEDYYKVLKFIEDNYKEFSIKLEYDDNNNLSYRMCKEKFKGYIYDTQQHKFNLQIINVLDTSK